MLAPGGGARSPTSGSRPTRSSPARGACWSPSSRTGPTRRASGACPAAGIDPGEDPLDAVVRECWEESGQHVQVTDLAMVQTSHWVGRAPGGRVEDFHAVRIVYRATCPAPTDPVVHDVGGTDRRRALGRPGRGRRPAAHARLARGAGRPVAAAGPPLTSTAPPGAVAPGGGPGWGNPAASQRSRRASPRTPRTRTSTPDADDGAGPEHRPVHPEAAGLLGDGQPGQRGGRAPPAPSPRCSARGSATGWSRGAVAAGAGR